MPNVSTRADVICARCTTRRASRWCICPSLILECRRRADLEQAIQHTLTHAQAGRHMVVHCAAGLGRTGLFLASLATCALGLSGAEAIQWVRPLLHQAIETPEQQRLLLHDAEA